MCINTLNVLFILGMATVDAFHYYLLHALFLRFEMNPLCNDLIFKSGGVKRDSVIPSWSVIESLMMSDFWRITDGAVQD